MKKSIAILAATFVALEAADAFVTVYGTNHGFQEANPIFAPFAHTWALPVVKVAFGLVVAGALALAADRFPKSAATCRRGLRFMVGIQAAVLGLWGVGFIIG